MSRGKALALLLAMTSASTALADQGGAPSGEEQLSQAHQAIIGGSNVEPGQWPDAVAVIGTNGTCTGTLIAPDVVLTAGHCAGVHPEQVIANTIDYSQSSDGVRVRVASTTPYPSWQSEYDVSVIVLASPIEGVEPRKVGTGCTFQGFSRTTPVRLVGYGATDLTGTAANTALRQAMTQVSDPDCSGGRGCKQAIAPGGEFVAGGSGTADSCFGDSGGPVYLDTPNGPVVVGAVSRGVDGSSTPCGGGGIYVRTDKLVDWIEQTTERAVAQDDCTGAAYSSEDMPDPQTSSVGCAASGGSGLGTAALLGLVWFGARKRRPRPRRRALRTTLPIACALSGAGLGELTCTQSE